MSKSKPQEHILKAIDLYMYIVYLKKWCKIFHLASRIFEIYIYKIMLYMVLKFGVIKTIT